MQFAFKTHRQYGCFSNISSLICIILYVLAVYQPCISAAANSKATNNFDYRYYQEQDTKKSPEITAVYSIAYPHWHNFWSGQDQQTIKRNILDIRVKKDISPYLRTGISILRASDSSRISQYNPRYNTQNYAWNWEYSRSNFTLSGESSLASTEESARYNINWFSPTYVTNNNKDIAHKIAAEVSNGSSQWEIDYEIVPPQYLSLINSATPDQETVRVKWRNRLGTDVNYHIGGSWFRDKIGAASTATYRTYSSNPGAGIIVREILGNPDAFLNVNYSQSNREGGGSEGRDGSWTVGYQDILGKVNIQTSVSYTNNRNSNNRMDISKNNNTTYNAALSTSYKQGRYNITPTLTWGYYQQNDLLKFEQEKTYETSLSIDTSEPGAAFSSLIKFGTKKLISPSHGDSPQWFANLNIDWVPPFLIKNPGSKIYFRALINDYKYNTSPKDNYRKTSYITGVSQTF